MPALCFYAGWTGCGLALFVSHRFGPARTGIWKDARTRRLESLCYVAQTFLSAGWGTFQSPIKSSVEAPMSDGD
jgi:hypothetical protein